MDFWFFLNQFKKTETQKRFLYYDLTFFGDKKLLSTFITKLIRKFLMFFI